VSVTDPKVNLLLDPGSRTPRTDEYSIGVDRELGSRLAVAAAYIHKDGTNFIAWTDVGGQYRQETRTLPDGRSLPVHVLTSPTESRRFLLTNPAGYSLTYNGGRHGRGEASLAGLARDGVLYVLEDRRAAGVERSGRR
jgi:hypothetical protein